MKKLSVLIALIVGLVAFSAAQATTYVTFWGNPSTPYVIEAYERGARSPFMRAAVVVGSSWNVSFSHWTPVNRPFFYRATNYWTGRADQCRALASNGRTGFASLYGGRSYLNASIGGGLYWVE